MGEINIRFRMNLETGKKDLVIDFESDEDAMRHEHEKRHRQIIQRLVGEGILNADEVGEVIVEREQPAQRVQQREGPQDGGEQAASASS